MKISLRTSIPTMTVGTLFALSSCSVDSDPLLNTKKYMMSTDRTQLEYSKLTGAIDPDNAKSLTILQSKLDSIAYRDLFNTTSAAKDSSKVAEFNKIAAKYRADFDKNSAKYKQGKKIENNLKKPINSLINKLTNSNISIRDLEEIKKETHYSDTCRLAQSACSDLYNWQHCADKWAYKKFFKEIGVFKQGLPGNFNAVSKMIKP